MGTFALVFVLFFLPNGPETFGVYCFLALVIGVAGSVFPLSFLHCSFHSPKSRQGAVLAAYIGCGAMGTSCFTLVLPFLLSAVGLGFSYLIFFFVHLAVILFVVFGMRDPPYFKSVLFAKKENVEIVTSWGDLKRFDEIAPQSALSFAQALESPSPEFEVMLQKRNQKLVVGVVEVQNVCTMFGKQEIFRYS